MVQNVHSFIAYVIKLGIIGSLGTNWKSRLPAAQFKFVIKNLFLDICDMKMFSKRVFQYGQKGIVRFMKDTNIMYRFK